MADVTDLLLTVIVAPVITGLVLFFIGLVVGRRLERKDRWRDDDKARIYEALYAEVSKLLLSEDSAKRGFSLNPPDTQVLEDILHHGLLVPPRHRWLKQDVEKLSALASTYNQRSFDFNVAANKAFQGAADATSVDAIKSDSALDNALRAMDKDAGKLRFDQIMRGSAGKKMDDLPSWNELFDMMISATATERASLQTATDELLFQAKGVRVGLEAALRHGKYRSAILRRR